MAMCRTDFPKDQAAINSLKTINKKIDNSVALALSSTIETKAEREAELSMVVAGIRNQGFLRNAGNVRKASLTPEVSLTLTNKDVAQTLTAFAMQMYYDKDTTATETLFDNTGIIGAIHFDREDVADTLDTAKGFNLYFENYLDTLPDNENEAITQQLPNLLDWYIQAGYRAMEAQAGDQRAFELGGDKGDNLFGGTDGDVLVGGVSFADGHELAFERRFAA